MRRRLSPMSARRPRLRAGAATCPPAAGGGIVNDLSRYRLRPPPPGYAWVRVNGGVALVSQATGQIFDIVPN